MSETMAASTAASQYRDQFPHFKDGDVLIILPGGRTCRLHSTTLRRASALFDDLLRVEGIKLSNKAIASGRAIRYRLDLMEKEEKHVFVRKELDNHGRAVDGSSIPWVNTDYVAIPEITRHYHALLGSFYGVDLRLDETSIESTVEDAIGILDVAQYTATVNGGDTPLSMSYADAFDRLIWYPKASRPVCSPRVKPSFDGLPQLLMCGSISLVAFNLESSSKNLSSTSLADTTS